MPLGSKPDREGTGGKTFHAKKTPGVRSFRLWERGTSSLFSQAPGRGHFHACLDLGQQLRLSVPHDDQPLVIHWTTCFLFGQRLRTRLRLCCTVNEEQERSGLGRQMGKILVRQCTVEAAARFCCDARRIAQLSSSSPHYGRSDLPLGTTTGFSKAACSPPDMATSSLIGQ